MLYMKKQLVHEKSKIHNHSSARKEILVDGHKFGNRIGALSVTLFLFISSKNEMADKKSGEQKQKKMANKNKLTDKNKMANKNKIADKNKMADKNNMTDQSKMADINKKTETK